jgi:hypothetical protein
VLSSEINELWWNVINPPNSVGRTTENETGPMPVAGTDGQTDGFAVTTTNLRGRLLTIRRDRVIEQCRQPFEFAHATRHLALKSGALETRSTSYSLAAGGHGYVGVAMSASYVGQIRHAGSHASTTRRVAS